MRVYLAGPMSGIPQFNFPTFAAAAADLRSRGYDVVSPHELDAEAEREAAWASIDGDMKRDLWASCLARDIYLIAADGIEAVVLLPNWRNSDGAKLETFVARLKKLPLYWYSVTDPLIEVSSEYAAEAHAYPREVFA